MQEYKIVRVVRLTEEKEKTDLDKKGRRITTTYAELESWENFYARTEKTLNDLAKEGWSAGSLSHAFPIVGNLSGGFGNIGPNYGTAEFVVLMSRELK